MKYFLPLLCGVGLAWGGAFTSFGGSPVTVAVFNFASHDEGARDLGPKVADLLSVNLSTNSNLILVERAELDKVLGEQELGLSGTVTPDSAARVGQLTGARVLVTGRVFAVSNTLVLLAKIIGTETSRVYGEVINGPPGVSIMDLAPQLADKIAADITTKANGLLATNRSRAELVADLKKTLDGKKFPSISVSIKEQHIGTAVIDPAAQVELQTMLQECGFTVVDDHSTEKPVIAITGEALSEFGMQKGNLRISRARVELTAREVGSGKILAVERQTSVGVDLAEQIAGKTALQNGIDELAGRFFPKLVP